MRATLSRIQDHPRLEVEVVATGMHLMPQFGKTIQEIKKDGWKLHPIYATYEKDRKESMASFLGKFIQLLTSKIRKIKPHFILLLGDRAEMLGGAIVGAYLTIPVAHVHGGDISSTIDEFARHAITKLSHIHFPATKNAAKRIIEMGEESWRVSVVGAPGLDYILHGRLYSKAQIEMAYSINFTQPLILVLQHPVTLEIQDAQIQMRETMEALRELRYQTIVLYPNADAGGKKMILIIEQYRRYPFVRIYKSVPYRDYISLMKFATVMVGNSSSGIVEAPSFHLPVVNIGTRQAGRERAGNTIEVDYRKKDIQKAIRKTLFDTKFRKKLRSCRSPYGSGTAGYKIASILSKIPIDKKLLQKQLTYS